MSEQPIPRPESPAAGDDTLPAGVPSVQRPLRIVVIGSSVGFFVRPPRAGWQDGDYAELLEAALRARGVPAEVVNASRWFLLVDEAFRRVESLVIAHRPHVVIADFGLLECEPKIVPTRLLRWMFTWRPGGGASARAARALLARPLTRAYRVAAPVLIRLLPVPRRVGPARFRREMTRFVRALHKERGATVLCCTVNPPGATLEQTLPGTAAGARRYNAILAEIVATEDGAALVDTAGLVEREGPEAVLPDGIHYSALGHRLVAELLCEQVMGLLAGSGSTRVSEPTAAPRTRPAR